MKRITTLLIAAGFLFSPIIEAKEAITYEINTASASESQPQPKPGNKGMRRMRNKMFTVNVFKHNKKIREKRDRELKSNRRGKNPKAHKANKNTKHILLRGEDNNHGFKNKRRW